MSKFKVGDIVYTTFGCDLRKLQVHDIYQDPIEPAFYTLGYLKTSEDFDSAIGYNVWENGIFPSSKEAAKDAVKAANQRMLENEGKLTDLRVARETGKHPIYLTSLSEEQLVRAAEREDSLKAIVYYDNQIVIAMQKFL